MTFWDIFTSRHTKFLEQELERMRADHAREIQELKNTYAAERSYVISENQRLRDDCERFRILLTPRLQPEDDTPPPEMTQVPVGSPWQRVLAREMAAQAAEAAVKVTASTEEIAKQVQGLKGAN